MLLFPELDMTRWQRMYKQAEMGRRQASRDAVGYSLNFHFISLRRSEGHSKTAECTITVYQTQTINSQTLSTDTACAVRKKRKKSTVFYQWSHGWDHYYKRACVQNESLLRCINAEIAATLKLVSAQAWAPSSEEKHWLKPRPDGPQRSSSSHCRATDQDQT